MLEEVVVAPPNKSSRGPRTFRVGNVVRLKSETFPMTVTAVPGEKIGAPGVPAGDFVVPPGFVFCSWFDATDRCAGALFPAASLTGHPAVRVES